MGASKTRPSTNTPLFFFLLISLFILSTLVSLILSLYHKQKLTAFTKWWPLLCIIGLIVALTLALTAAARATMVTWITVLVLLAFAGNRRRVLVKRGRTITNDVAMFLVGVLVNERPSLLAVACATLFSLIAVMGIRESQLISL